MAQTIKMVIQLRRDTAANWELYKDIIPAAGEPCFVIDKNILKIGDGITSFEKLEPINGAKFELEADGKSIVLSDNTLKLIGFDTAEVGAQPRKNADGNLEWVVPSTATVDGLKSAVDDLQSDVASLQTTVITIQEIVSPSAEGSIPLNDRVATLEDIINGVGDDSVDAKIDAKINEFVTRVSDDKTVNTIKELVDYVAEHGPETAKISADISALQGLVGETSVQAQIENAVKNSGHISKVEAEATLLSKVEAKKTLQHVKYEISDTPAGTLVDYRDKEIRVMCPANSVFTKQSVGTGGNPNKYYMTFKTYAPSDDAVGYIEHLGDQSDAEILTSFSTDKYGRRYQPTWLALAEYDEATDTWAYFGKNSTVNKYVGWDYQIDWYDANGVMIASDSVRINLSNEDCYNVVEPYYMAGVVKGVSVGDTLMDIVDGIVKMPTNAGLNSSEEIIVNEDGTLSVGVISIDKIIQNEDEYIIMDGGGAI